MLSLAFLSSATSSRTPSLSLEHICSYLKKPQTHFISPNCLHTSDLFKMEDTESFFSYHSDNGDPLLKMHGPLLLSPYASPCLAQCILWDSSFFHQACPVPRNGPLDCSLWTLRIAIHWIFLWEDPRSSTTKWTHLVWHDIFQEYLIIDFSLSQLFICN